MVLEVDPLLSFALLSWFFFRLSILISSKFEINVYTYVIIISDSECLREWWTTIIRRCHIRAFGTCWPTCAHRWYHPSSMRDWSVVIAWHTHFPFIWRLAGKLFLFLTLEEITKIKCKIRRLSLIRLLGLRFASFSIFFLEERGRIRKDRWGSFF